MGDIDQPPVSGAYKWLTLNPALEFIISIIAFVSSEKMAAFSKFINYSHFDCGNSGLSISLSICSFSSSR